jgi:very-short-patch-repair endonuclease
VGDFKKFDFKKIKELTRELRRKMTEYEKVLWNELRGRRLSGYKFLCQHPIIHKGNLLRYNYFVADFYCDTKKTVIELDGPIHEAKVEYDGFRESELEDRGLHILRIRNEELSEMDDVLQKIKLFLSQIPDIK